MRHTFENNTLRIEFKTDDGTIERDDEYTYSVNPTTNPPEMTIYAKGRLVMGIYKLDGDDLKLASHGISEWERPRGFDLKDKRVTDMPLCIMEFKRKK